jgi:hypothetical protein
MSNETARIEQLERALRDMLSGWRYIREYHGDLAGVGWDRCEQSASAALAAAPQPAQEPPAKLESEVDTLAREIHAALKKRKPAGDHGTVGNLRCALDHLLSSQAEQPDSDHSAQVVREAPPKPIWTPPGLQSAPAALDAWVQECMRLADECMKEARWVGVVAQTHGGESDLHRANRSASDARADLEAKLKEMP